MRTQDDALNLVSIGSRAARSAGNLLKQAFDAKTTALAVSHRDVKTQADLDSHKLLLRELADSNIPVLSEESESSSINPAKDKCWIIDPLDGTVNFFKGSPLNCTSVALWNQGKPIFGIVYDFISDDLYLGGPALPSTCNDRRISTSSVTESSQGLISTGFPNARNFESDALVNFVSQVQSFKKVRLLGSAALSLAWVASGKVDAYFEEEIYIWDIAAGLAICQGVGAAFQISPVDPKTRKLTLKVASTEELLQCLKC